MTMLKITVDCQWSFKNPLISEMDECCNFIQVFYGTTNQEYTYADIYGYYVRQEDLVNGRAWYKNEDKSIWWDQGWFIGLTTGKGISGGSLRGFSLKYCSTQFRQNSLSKFKRYLAFPALNQVGKKQKSKKNMSSKLFCTSFFYKTPRFFKKSCLI